MYRVLKKKLVDYTVHLHKNWQLTILAHLEFFSYYAYKHILQRKEISFFIPQFLEHFKFFQFLQAFFFKKEIIRPILKKWNSGVEPRIFQKGISLALKYEQQIELIKWCIHNCMQMRKTKAIITLTLSLLPKTSTTHVEVSTLESSLTFWSLRDFILCC